MTAYVRHRILLFYGYRPDIGARNVRLYYPYWQYTDLFISICIPTLPTQHTTFISILNFTCRIFSTISTRSHIFQSFLSSPKIGDTVMYFNIG